MAWGPPLPPLLLLAAALLALACVSGSGARELDVDTAQELADAVGEFGASGRDLLVRLHRNITVTNSTSFWRPTPGSFSAGTLEIVALRGKCSWLPQLIMYTCTMGKETMSGACAGVYLDASMRSDMKPPLSSGLAHFTLANVTLVNACEQSTTFAPGLSLYITTAFNLAIFNRSRQVLIDICVRLCVWVGWGEMALRPAHYGAYMRIHIQVE